MCDPKLLIKYEQGESTTEELVTLFQEMIDTDEAWQLGGTYAYTASHLINLGLCKSNSLVNRSH